MTSTATTIGAWVGSASSPITSTELTLRALDLVAHWKRCGLTADWLGSFLQYDFEPEARAAASELLSTVMNELVENAAKFAADKNAPLHLAARHHGDAIVLETRSVADEARVERLRSAMLALESEDLAELFQRRIERQNEPGSSGLGLLILKRDYGVRLAARFEPRAPGLWNVVVQAVLDTEEVGR
jgi:hypothetical protein